MDELETGQRVMVLLKLVNLERKAGHLWPCGRERSLLNPFSSGNFRCLKGFSCGGRAPCRNTEATTCIGSMHHGTDKWKTLETILGAAII